jgi:hypothetical protein
MLWACHVKGPFRIFGYAAFDVIGTVAIALIITYIWGGLGRFVEVCLSAFAGIALHYIFGVDRC